MHLLVGILVTLGAFVASQIVTEATHFGGLVNPSALVLLLIGPIGVTLISHPFWSWRANLIVLARAFRHDKEKNLVRASEEMTSIARAVRESRWNEAEDAVARAQSEQVKNLAPYLLARLELPALHEAVASASFKWMTEVKAADDFFQGLARFSPAFGMIGTIMGLVDLFKNMENSAALGPGMAMALLATLYGLILCYCVYMPLSARIRTYLTAGAHEQRVIERSLNLITEGRTIGEIRGAVLDGTITGSVVATNLPSPSEAQGRG
jgi:chemotaxis protein MotA